jgi:hypothetical protein
MKKFVIILVIIGLALIAWFYTRKRYEPASPSTQFGASPAPINKSMILTSPSFKNGEYIPDKFGCLGGGVNPELQIQNVPSEAKSLALIMHDPDAPRTGGFTHWLVWNIDPKINTIREESVPSSAEATAGEAASAVEGKNDAGKYGYIGPCPPPGNPHHYHFKLYALDGVLKLSKDSGKADLEAEIGKYVLAEAGLVGLYGR